MKLNYVDKNWEDLTEYHMDMMRLASLKSSAFRHMYGEYNTLVSIYNSISSESIGDSQKDNIVEIEKKLSEIGKILIDETNAFMEDMDSWVPSSKLNSLYDILEPKAEYKHRGPKPPQQQNVE